MHLSGDDEQLRPAEEDTKDNCFAHYTNRSLFERLVTLGYPHILLTEQYRAIPIIGDIVSTVWYKDQVRSSVDPSFRPNMTTATTVLRSFCGIERPLAFLNVNGTDIRVGASQSKQNEVEAIVATELAKAYAEAGIPAKDIVILTGYTAQVQLLKRSLALDPKVRDVEAYTVDSFQGEEASVVILCMVGTRKLG